MQTRQYLARGVGSLFIWWGFQGAFLVGSYGALVFGAYTGGAIAALGIATTGFDGIYEALVALAVVLVVAGLGLVAWVVAGNGVGSLWLLDDAGRVLLLTTRVRLQFVLPVVLGGASGGLLNRWLASR